MLDFKKREPFFALMVILRFVFMLALMLALTRDTKSPHYTVFCSIITEDE